MGAPAPNVLLVALQGGLIEPVDHLMRVDLVPSLLPQERAAVAHDRARRKPLPCEIDRGSKMKGQLIVNPK